MTDVRDNEKMNRYELKVDGKMAYTEYQLSPGTIIVMHTEVPNELRGKGIGLKLARGVMESIRVRNLKVIPRCPFIAAYIREHPEFQDLVSDL